jgi:ABC-type antimicrobial peptide transport system permease subunit
MAYVVLQRRREIGVRMAIGAAARRIARDVLRGGLQLVLSGIAVGTAASSALMHGLKSILYGVGITDASVLVASALILCTIGLLASYAPVRRAANADPMTALRCE